MSEMRKITFFTNDDWVWVYADDRLVFEGHSVSGEQLLDALDYEDFESHESLDFEDEEVINACHVGLRLSEFPTHKFGR